MSSLESLWIYITVPAAIIGALIFVKIRLQKTEKPPDDNDNNDKVLLPDETPEFTQPLTPEELRKITHESEPEPVTQPINRHQPPTRSEPLIATDVPDEEKPANCPHYMGFLYMRKGSERSRIPSECYQCQKLLRCLYSPRAMEKVYGNGQ